ncbi:YceD family protein [Legionella saoudiensis]|uniref:YceD family protein n=1 Tax=Legionella saoudiensis TaxID=1750561 RepID=UPI0007302C06|nr:YceD family protein [Legionella saoudiensis]
MLYLQELVKQGQQSKTVTLSERLPRFVATPCVLNASYHVETKEDFYLIHLHVNGELKLQCQRCLDEFSYPYDNSTIIAACRTDERAEELLEHYECVVAPNLQVSLDDLIIDELHLYAPQFHPETEDCSKEINQFLTEKNGES